MLLAVAVALCLRMLPGITAATRSAIWMAVFAIAFALHFVPAFAYASPAGSPATHPVRLAAGWSVALAAVWLLLSLLRGVQFAVSAWRLRQVIRRAEPIAPPPSPTPTIARRYRVCVSPDVDRPSVLGFLSPRVLLPPGLAARLTPAELQQVLLHETEHLSRADDWTNLLQKLALVLFPLNPVLLWVERRLCLERELACDDRVLESAGTRKAYAACLTQLAEHTILRRGITLALGVLGMPRHSELARRVHRILARPQRVMGRTASRLATASLLLCVGAASVGLARSPLLVSFTAAPESPATSQSLAQAIAIPASANSTYPEAHMTWAKAIMPSPQPAVPLHVAARRKAIQRRPAPRPRLIVATVTNEQLQPAPKLQQPRMTLTVTTTQQVQHLYVPAVMRVPAYAAFATPDGWIIIQL